MESVDNDRRKSLECIWMAADLSCALSCISVQRKSLSFPMQFVALILYMIPTATWPNARNIFRVQTTPFTCHVLKKTFAFQNRLHFSHGLAARWKRNVTRWISIVFPRIFRLSHIQPIGSNISEKIPSKLDELFCMKDCLRTSSYIYCLIVIYRIKTSIQFLIKIFWHFFFNLFMISYRIFKYVSGRIFIKFFLFSWFYYHQ